MSQRGYLYEPGTLLSGMKADLVDDAVKSYKNTTGAVVPFGVAVCIGASDDVLARIDSVTDKIVGIVVHDHATSNQGSVIGDSDDPFYDGSEDPSYGVPDKKTANVMRFGVIAVKVESAVTAESDVYVRHTVTTTELLGALRGDADSGKAARLSGAKFLTAADAGDVAFVFLFGDLRLMAGETTALGKKPGLISLVVGAEAAVAANAIEIAGTLVDLQGNVITDQRPVHIQSLPTTADQGDIAAAGTPVGTGFFAQNSATGENNASIIPTAAGLFSFRITNTVAEVNQVVVTADGCLPRVLRLTFA